MPFFSWNRLRLGSWLTAMVVIASAGCRPVDGGAPRESVQVGAPHRIVSLAPSVTEVLLALDLEDRVVGVTRYCRWRGAAPSPPEVGGYLDINTEAIVALEPDLVVLIQDHDRTRDRFERLGLRTLQVDQRRVSTILDSIRTISSACGVPDRGTDLAREISDHLVRVESMTRGRRRPRTLVVVGRDAGSRSLDTVWVAGRSTFYNDVLDLAGGVNVVEPSAVLYPEVSREGLLHLDPDVILDLLADLGDRRIDPATALADWNEQAGLRAVREGRLYQVEHPWAVVPGPRIADLVEEVARLLHPEAGW